MACDSEYEHHRLAAAEWASAREDQILAELALAEEQGFWEEESVGSAAGFATFLGGIIAGLTGPAGWAAGTIAFGTVAGGGAIVYSESDRQDDIDAARNALTRANKAIEFADRRLALTRADWCRCRAAPRAPSAPSDPSPSPAPPAPPVTP